MAPRLKSLSPRAVIFDIYGTLLVSAAGDVGVDAAEDDERAFSAALADGGWQCQGRGGGVSLLAEGIRQVHRQRHEAGIDCPEVDILAIWEEVLVKLSCRCQDTPEEALALCALSYECRVNPVWPMPGLIELLQALHRQGLLLGILSNAQFYTPIIFEYFLGATLEEAGFHPDLCLFSWQQGRAKPDGHLFADMQARLERLDCSPSQAVYVGNDMRKDIEPARNVGWQPVLFAGDARSLRLAGAQAEIAAPELVISSLSQLNDMIDV